MTFMRKFLDLLNMDNWKKNRESQYNSSQILDYAKNMYVPELEKVKCHEKSNINIEQEVNPNLVTEEEIIESFKKTVLYCR